MACLYKSSKTNLWHLLFTLLVSFNTPRVPLEWTLIFGIGSSRMAVLNLWVETTLTNLYLQKYLWLMTVQLWIRKENNVIVWGSPPCEKLYKRLTEFRMIEKHCSRKSCSFWQHYIPSFWWWLQFPWLPLPACLVSRVTILRAGYFHNPTVHWSELTCSIVIFSLQCFNLLFWLSLLADSHM